MPSTEVPGFVASGNTLRPFNHRSPGALSLFLSVVAREKKQKEGEKNGRKKKRHMKVGPAAQQPYLSNHKFNSTTKKPPWKLYTFYGDIRVVSNPDVKPGIT
uniref:Uncharacterized protein n=1 Tax=Oryza nivara TaxID=4536 RepID=A0A0E0ID76_ORYNI